MSEALGNWRVERARHLDELLHAHQLVGGPTRGRRWRTGALNGALVLQLAAEFQGFARDLHDLASDVFANWTASGNAALERVVRLQLTNSRFIDRGNAQPGSIGADFGRFGFRVWPALSGRDANSARYQAALDQVNQARNAIAHADDAKLGQLRAAGLPLTLRTFRSWRRDLDQLVGTLDVEVAHQLGRLFGQAEPW
jgi:hypothetical protein